MHPHFDPPRDPTETRGHGCGLSSDHRLFSLVLIRHASSCIEAEYHYGCSMSERYLRPTLNHLAVAEYIHPDRFEEVRHVSSLSIMSRVSSFCSSTARVVSSMCAITLFLPLLRVNLQKVPPGSARARLLLRCLWSLGSLQLQGRRVLHGEHAAQSQLSPHEDRVCSLKGVRVVALWPNGGPLSALGSESSSPKALSLVNFSKSFTWMSRNPWLGVCFNITPRSLRSCFKLRCERLRFKSSPIGFPETRVAS